MSILQNFIRDESHNGTYHIMDINRNREHTLLIALAIPESLEMALVDAALLYMRKVMRPRHDTSIQVGCYQILFKEWFGDVLVSEILDLI